MDPRHPPHHPFSRGGASSYPPHAPFQSASNPSPTSFPPASHSQPATSLYQENPRRAAESSYYAQSNAYPRDGAPIPPSGHSRQGSATSIGHGTPIARNMPPPSSPQQQQQPHAQHPHSHSYPAPTIGRGPPPPPPLSTSNGFPPSRDLPSISSVHRPSSVNSSMSISSMLGVPPESREPAQPPSQYPPPPMISSAPSSSSYPAPTHASPRTSGISSDYDRFRRPERPRTPELRHYESQGLRDRANSAGSPTRTATISTPDANRYSATQAYPQRSMHHQHTSSLDNRREHHPVRVPNPNATFPPRPSSQPAAYSGPPSRQAETSRRVVDTAPPEPPYARVGYGEREDVHAYREASRLEEEVTLRRQRERLEDLERMDRERMERERMERERIDREVLERERMNRERMEQERIQRDRLDHREAQYQAQPGPTDPYARQYSQQQTSSYSDSREPPPWMMQSRRDQQGGEQPPPSYTQAPTTAGYEHPRNAPQPYSGPPGYANESRFASSYGQGQNQPRSSAMSQYESSVDDRQRIPSADQSQQHNYHGPSPAQPGPYRHYESPPRARPVEEAQQPQQRNYLGLQQEINRKGRSSPFPQAVQGAQIQHSGPGGEPGIKSEFGKMFSGIGSGVGSMATPGATSSGAQTPFSSSGQLRREDLDGLMSQDSLTEIGGHRITGTSSRGGRRRKLKEEDGRGDDDSSAGRRTPSGRGPKRPKNSHQPAAGTAHRQMSQRQDSGDHASSPSQPFPAPLSGAAPAQVLSSPPAENKITVPHHHHINRHHHHHHHHDGLHRRSTPVPAPAVIPKPKQIVRSKAVLDSVAHLPRRHLGHGIYQSHLRAGETHPLDHSTNTRRGFASTPEPLPRFEGSENCTYTVRVPRIHLTEASREEITSRRALWGTDIYSDDSDVIAACIHGGWMRGEWPEDVDVSLLGIVISSPGAESKDITVTGESNGKPERKKKVGAKSKRDILLTEPPAKGPMQPLPGCDLHVTILVLPALEKYSSTVRFGIKSREWAATHDGLSFMITNIRWVRGTSTTDEASGKGRRTRMKLALEDDAINDDAPWGGFLENGNGHKPEGGGSASESYIRGEGRGPLAEISGLGMKSWWKARDPDKAVESVERVADVEVKTEVALQEESRHSEAVVVS